LKASSSGIRIDQPVNEEPPVRKKSRKNPEKSPEKKIQKKKLPDHLTGGLKLKKAT